LNTPYKLMGVKHPSEFVALSTAHARKQFESMIAQTKELTELAQKVTTEITEPVKAGA
jgi:phasin family protein